MEFVTIPNMVVTAGLQPLISNLGLSLKLLKIILKLTKPICAPSQICIKKNKLDFIE